MPRKAIKFTLEPNNQVTNFQQIISLAEKLMESLSKSVQQGENILKKF